MRKLTGIFLIGLGALSAALLYQLIENEVNISESEGEPSDSPITYLEDFVKNNVIAPVKSIFGTKYDDLIISSANQNGLSPDLLYKLLYQESHFREDIITGKKTSPAGALGIAQFMPATAVQELGSVEAALDPNQAIPGAARYLAKLIKSAGSLQGGVAAYNWGIGRVLKKGLKSAPAETRNYVLAITGVDIA